MTVLKPTEKELELHTRAVAKLRSQLFRKYSPSDFHIIGEMSVVAPSVYEVQYPDSIKRTVHLGGLEFPVDRGEEQNDYQIIVSHDQRDTFNLYGFVLPKKERTAFSTSAKFRDIDKTLFRLIAALRKNKVVPSLAPMPFRPMAGNTERSDTRKRTLTHGGANALRAMERMQVEVKDIQSDESRGILIAKVTATSRSRIKGIPVAETRPAAMRRARDEALRFLDVG
jgi:hypothetical protein